MGHTDFILGLHRVFFSWKLTDVNIKLFSFAEDSILFECRYARSVTVDSDPYNVPPPEDCTTCSMNGDLTYTMNVDVGELGGNTNVRITPNFNFGQVAPR